MSSQLQLTTNNLALKKLQTYTMTRKILSLKTTGTKHRETVASDDAAQVDDPLKRFMNGVAIDPGPRMQLERGSTELSVRALDLIAPIGMGQRGLVVAPPGSGKTTMLKHICEAVGKAYPKTKLYALLIDERPEEVTDFKRSVAAEVHASSSDDPSERHLRIADQLLDTARREAGEGLDVMIVIDSLTRLSRAHNAQKRSSGRTMSGGLDARAMEIPRKLFGAARKIENGGSLTILATLLVDTGSQMDQVIHEEFRGTGNMDLVLARRIAQQRIFPALDIAKSGTRREERLLSANDLDRLGRLRRALADLKPEQAAAKLVELLQKFPTNAELLDQFKPASNS